MGERRDKNFGDSKTQRPDEGLHLCQAGMARLLSAPAKME